MVDLNLKDLSAPIELLRSDVSAAYKRLDKQWAEIAAQLKSLPIPCKIGTCVHNHPRSPESSINLEWRKWRGKFRFCYTYHDHEHDEYLDEYVATENVTPYDEWGAERKVEMLEHVPALFENAAKQITDFIERTNSKGGDNENSSS